MLTLFELLELVLAHPVCILLLLLVRHLSEFRLLLCSEEPPQSARLGEESLLWIYFLRFWQLILFGLQVLDEQDVSATWLGWGWRRRLLKCRIVRLLKTRSLILVCLLDHCTLAQDVLSVRRGSGLAIDALR